MNDFEAFVESFAQGWADRDPQSLKALMDSEVRSLYAGMPEPVGVDGVVDYLNLILELVPDIDLRPVRWAVVDDSIFIEWTAMGTIGGQRFEVAGTDRFTLRDGLIVEGRAYYDTAPLMAAVAATNGSAAIEKVLGTHADEQTA